MTKITKLFVVFASSLLISVAAVAGELSVLVHQTLLTQ